MSAPVDLPGGGLQENEREVGSQGGEPSGMGHGGGSEGSHPPGRKNLGVQKGRAQGERDMKNGVKRLSPIQEQNLRSHTAALSCHWLKMRVSVSFISFYSTPQEGLMNSNLTPIMLDSRALTRI